MKNPKRKNEPILSPYKHVTAEEAAAFAAMDAEFMENVGDSLRCRVQPAPRYS